jgi:hypothetical protein
VSAPSWQAFYDAGWQFPFAVMVVPFAFLLYRALAHERSGRALDPALAPFVSLWVTLFTLETLLDPIATGPLAHALDTRFLTGFFSQALGTLFVVLGDFRVYWLVLRFRTPQQTTLRAALEALALSAPAPLLAGLVSLRAGTGQVMWLSHELVSLGLAFALARFAAPSEAERPHHAAFVRSALGFMAAYYGLWVAADGLILSGVEAGWPVRLVPNQLYYGFFVPFVWWKFFGSPARSRG